TSPSMCLPGNCSPRRAMHSKMGLWGAAPPSVEGRSQRICFGSAVVPESGKRRPSSLRASNAGGRRSTETKLWRGFHGAVSSRGGPRSVSSDDTFDYLSNSSSPFFLIHSRIHGAEGEPMSRWVLPRITRSRTRSSLSHFRPSEHWNSISSRETGLPKR
ncbi:MAG: hypothetical protein RLZZ142_16, partial [Verrucomicrobiota bacterium]